MSEYFSTKGCLFMANFNETSIYNTGQDDSIINFKGKRLKLKLRLKESRKRHYAYYNHPKRDEVLIRGWLSGGGGMVTYRATLNNI